MEKKKFRASISFDAIFEEADALEVLREIHFNLKYYFNGVIVIGPRISVWDEPQAPQVVHADPVRIDAEAQAIADKSARAIEEAPYADEVKVQPKEEPVVPVTAADDIPF